MRIIIVILGMLYSSFLYAEIDINNSIGLSLQERIKLVNNFDFKGLKKNEFNQNLDIQSISKYGTLMPEHSKKVIGKDKCVFSICVNEKLSMGQSLKDYSDVALEPLQENKIEDMSEKSVKNYKK